jgi:CHAT domain-containing protein
MRFLPLPASEREVEEIAEVWQGFGASQPVTTLFRDDALEASFKRLAAGRQVLHLSTHGFYLGAGCPVYELPGRWAADVSMESPLLRSGLAFAGANHRQAALPSEDDGILTAEEVAALDLLGVDWAVLSACESGLGDVQTGEGVLGLRRTFAAAGVRTLIMSLWPVDDDVTRDWMSQLYRHRFMDGLSTIEAVHHTNLDLLAARRTAGESTHPFYWAGFVAAGDWR